jgi:glycyl-tRNA synthetase
MNWYAKLGIKKENLRFKDHTPNERAHYARAATDIEYNGPFGWAEFMGIHHRGDWDLKRHQEYSGQSMIYKDQEAREEYIPWDIETSAGVDRSLLFFLIDAYHEEKDPASANASAGKRVVLKLHPKLAPYKVAVFPLLANKPQLVEKARKIYEDLKPYFMTTWDDRGNIGKRYYSQDEIGTPYCVTVDFDTLENDTITVRDRNSTKQERIKIDKIKEYLEKALAKF